MLLDTEETRPFGTIRTARKTALSLAALSFETEDQAGGIA